MKLVENLSCGLLAVSLLGLAGCLAYHALLGNCILLLPASAAAWLGYALLRWLQEGKGDY